jgi:hypothetical protein
VIIIGVIIPIQAPTIGAIGPSTGNKTAPIMNAFPVDVKSVYCSFSLSQIYTNCPVIEVSITLNLSKIINKFI